MTNITLLLLSFFTFAHPLHLSMSSLSVDKNNNAKLTVKLFSDDLERAIFQHSKVNVDLQNDSLLSGALPATADYILSQMKISADNLPIILKAVGIEKNHEACWIHFSGKISNFKVLEIKNNLMNSLFRDQRNLLIVSRNSKDIALRFDKNKTRERVLSSDL